MVFGISEKSKRIVGALGRGDEVVSSLERLCREQSIRAGELRAVGTLSEVVLGRIDPNTRRLEESYAGSGVMEVVSLHGHVGWMGDELALRLQAHLRIDTPLGPQYAFGLLQQAVAEDLEWVFDVFVDLETQRSLDPVSCRLVIGDVQAVETPSDTSENHTAPSTAPTTSAPVSAEPETVPAVETSARPAPPASTLSWEEASAPGATPPAPSSAPDWLDEDDDEEEPELQPGDVLDHPKLGVCRVMRVEPGEYAHIRLGRGKIRKLSLQVCALIPMEETPDGHMKYKVRVRR